jgi:hypothetical protein
LVIEKDGLGNIPHNIVLSGANYISTVGSAIYSPYPTGNIADSSFSGSFMYPSENIGLFTTSTFTNTNSRGTIKLGGTLSINTITNGRSLNVGGIPSEGENAIISIVSNKGVTRLDFGTVLNTDLGRIGYTTANNTITIGNDTRVSGSISVLRGFTALADSSIIGRLDVSGNLTVTGDVSIKNDSINISTPRTIPSVSNSGTVGDFCWDTNYFYVCIAPNTWRRIGLLSW